MTVRRTTVAAVAGLVLAAAAVVAHPGAASAHDSLIGASPSEGETVTTAIDAVTLSFSASLLGVESGGNLAIVTGPDGLFYETDCVSVAGADVTLPVALGPSGQYEVDWRVVSSDGHPVAGSYVFTYGHASASDPAAGSASHPCAGVDSSASDASPAGPESGLGVGLAYGGAALAVVAAVVAVILWRGRRDTDRDNVLD